MPQADAEEIINPRKQKNMATRPSEGQIKVVDILIHPFKSCRGLSLKECKFTPEGLEHDRRYCIIDAKNHNLMTTREAPKMVLITPSIDGDKLTANFPSGSGVKSFTVPIDPTPEQFNQWDLIDDIKFFSDKIDGHIVTPLDDTSGNATESLSEYFGKPCYLVYKGTKERYVEPTIEFPDLKATAKYQDGYPILVLSEESMGLVEKEVRSRIGQQGVEENWKEDKVHYRRFRPNIVISGGGPFAEDNWEEITVGDPFNPILQLVNKCARCLLPNVSPDTGIRDKAVPYKIISKFRMGLDPKNKLTPCVGSNTVPLGNGTVRVGDIVYVRRMLGEEDVTSST